MRTLRNGVKILAALPLTAGTSQAAIADADIDALVLQAERYAGCLVAADTQCIYELTHPLARIQGFGPVSAYPGPKNRVYTEGSEHGYPPLTQTSVVFPAAKSHLPEIRDTNWTLEVGAPTPLDVDSELQFAVMPYLQSAFAGTLTERRGYLIGVSADNRNWCFVEDTAVVLRGLDRVLPGYEGPPLPEMSVTIDEAPGRMRSEFFDTLLAGFSIVGHEGDGHYELNLEVREKIRQQTPLLIVYQNPRNSDEPVIDQASLEPKQEELRIRSPLIAGFVSGETYRVGLFGVDDKTDEILFEHYQPMVFRPVPGLDDQFMPAISGLPGQSFPLPGLSFPPGWYEYNLDASIGGLCPAASK